MNKIKTLTPTDEYLKRIEPYVILDYNLIDIVTYVKSTINYLNSNNKEDYDLKEIISYLSTVPEIVKEIRKITKEMEIKLNEYELY